MSKIPNTGTAIIMLGLAAMVAAPALARGANFDRATRPNPTVQVNYNPGYASSVLFHGHYPAHPARGKRGH
jgi:hypothetical protein